MKQPKPIDPFAIKKLSKLHPYRLVWTAYSRLLEQYGKLTHQSLVTQMDRFQPEHLFREQGDSVPDTAHEFNVQKLLRLAIEATESFSEPVVELGSYRGVTTQNFATATKRLVYAIDPYIGYGGWELDMTLFQQRTTSLANVCHLRETSGEAFKKLQGQSLSLLFIDSVPDFVNIWFNLGTWGSLVKPGGLIAVSSDENHPGANLACRRILARPEYTLWGYCPDMVIVQKNSFEVVS